jgi:hypothetical protein
MSEIGYLLRSVAVWGAGSPLEVMPWICAILMIYFAQYSRTAFWFIASFVLDGAFHLVENHSQNLISNAIHPYHISVVSFPIILLSRLCFVAGCWQLGREIAIHRDRIESWNAEFGGDMRASVGRRSSVDIGPSGTHANR